MLLEHADAVLSVLALDEDLCSEMIRAFQAMADAMLEEHIIMDNEYLVAIFRFFHVLIADFFGPLIHRVDVCCLINAVLNESANLY